MDSRCEELLRISGKAFSDFRPYRELCQDIAQNFYPMRADFTSSLQVMEFASNALDGTPVNARETLGNAIDAMLRQGEWFRIGTGDEEFDNQPGNTLALKRGTQLLRKLVYHPRSLFAAATKETDMDWVSFGGFSMSVEASRDLSHLVYKPWHLRDCAWLLDDDGVVDTHYRNMQMTARDIMRRIRSGAWKGTVSPVIERCEQYEPMRKFTLRHILMPTDDLYGGSREDMRRIRHPYNSIYVDVENRTYLHERGAPVFNYVVGRHRTLSGLPYGFSPMALNSLPDARMLQDMALVIIEQGQKAVDPPTLGAAQVFTRDMNFFAGGHTEVDLEDGQRLRDVFATIDTGNMGVGLELKQDVRSLIGEAWLLNKLMLPTLRDMREVEVMVRTDEFRRAALPFFQPIETSYHGELLGCTLEMGAALNLIPPGTFGGAFEGKETSFIFSSPLNEAEGAEIVQAYNSAINIVSAGAQIDQTVASIFNLRKAAEDALARGTKPEWLIPEDEREEAAAEAEQISGLTKGAEIARQAAGVTADVASASMAADQAGLAMPAA